MVVNIFIEDELKQVVDRVNAKLSSNFKFYFGEDEHVIKVMRDMKSLGQEWSPLFALVLPVDIEKGNSGGYYGTASVPRIVIASITDQNKAPLVRKETVIKPIIQPFYNEFLHQMTRQMSFAIMGNRIEHRHRIRYGTQQAAQGFAEYIDGIEILDLKITLNQNV